MVINKEKRSNNISIKPNDLKLEKYKIFLSYFEHLNNCYWDYNQWDFLK